MTQETETAYQRVVQTLRDLYGPLPENSGLAEADIAAAEARLGVRFPALLRAYYALTGDPSLPFHHEHNRLLALNELEVEDDKLIFYEENQVVVVWGVVLDGTEDPPIFQTTSDEDAEWFRESDHLSGFLRFMLFMQGVWAGAMAFVSSDTVEPDILERIDREWPRVPGLPDEANGFKIYQRGGQALLVSLSDDGETNLFLGARTEADAASLEAEFDIPVLL